jgi:hypothetical protein
VAQEFTVPPPPPPDPLAEAPSEKVILTFAVPLTYVEHLMRICVSPEAVTLHAPVPVAEVTAVVEFSGKAFIATHEAAVPQFSIQPSNWIVAENVPLILKPEDALFAGTASIKQAPAVVHAPVSDAVIAVDANNGPALIINNNIPRKISLHFTRFLLYLNIPPEISK